MTREEAIAILIREIDEDPFMRTEYREQIHEALNMAIEALKQEPVLDKIKAEIEASRWTSKRKIERNALACGLDKALEIIDKYEAESEEG